MKTKIFILMILFLGIGAISFAQSATSTTSDKKDAPSQTVAPAKTGECTGHQGAEMKSECKFVDANKDGVCDTCGKTEKECAEKCKKDEPKKEGCGTACPMHKECGEAAPKKDGKK
jgi:hypothetical protein